MVPSFNGNIDMGAPQSHTFRRPGSGRSGTFSQVPAAVACGDQKSAARSSPIQWTAIDCTAIQRYSSSRAGGPHPDSPQPRAAAWSRDPTTGRRAVRIPHIRGESPNPIPRRLPLAAGGIQAATGRCGVRRLQITRTTTASLDMRDHLTVEPEYGASITSPLPAASCTCSGPRALNELAGKTRSPGRTSCGEIRSPE